ncbi:MAG TPA: lysophospholipid acyltransferase family protein [Anaerolineales bacterium]|nr:lysophospholipid acyltransferase family protein [Anaerolineales bacterium]
MGYLLIRLFIDFLCRFIAPVEIQGKENIPASGAFIGVSNHVGVLDPALVYFFLDRKDITILVAEKYQKYAILRWVVKQLKSSFVDRFNADLGAMRVAFTRLRQGGVLVIAPEGTRSKTGGLIEGQPGASYLAARTGVPIVPAGIIGSRDGEVISKFRHLHRPHITVRIGSPFNLPKLDGKDREAAIQQYTDEVMCLIAALLPPDYHGIYADHPRLNEFLAEKEEKRLSGICCGRG